MSEEQKVGDLPEAMYRNPRVATTTLKKSDLQRLLLRTDGWVMACGTGWDILSKHIGADVYKVWLRERQ